jgi:uncharacterized membrane protein YidH (DUF202 family)
MKALLNVSVALMAFTGVAFAVMKYWMKSDDPFAVINHPMQPYALDAHVLIGPLALFAFGWTFAAHILPALAKGAPKRATGIWTMVFIALMVASGFLMQVSTGDATRKAFAVAHWISSALFVIGYAAHLTGRRPSS